MHLTNSSDIALPMIFSRLLGDARPLLLAVKKNLSCVRTVNARLLSETSCSDPGAEIPLANGAYDATGTLRNSGCPAKRSGNCGCCEWWACGRRRGLPSPESSAVRAAAGPVERPAGLAAVRFDQSLHDPWRVLPASLSGRRSMINGNADWRRLAFQTMSTSEAAYVPTAASPCPGAPLTATGARHGT
jgi:hypothetical protein